MKRACLSRLPNARAFGPISRAGSHDPFRLILLRSDGKPFASPPAGVVHGLDMTTRSFTALAALAFILGCNAEPSEADTDDDVPTPCTDDDGEHGTTGTPESTSTTDTDDSDTGEATTDETDTGTETTTDTNEDGPADETDTDGNAEAFTDGEEANATEDDETDTTETEG